MPRSYFWSKTTRPAVTGLILNWQRASWTFSLLPSNLWGRQLLITIMQSGSHIRSGGWLSGAENPEGQITMNCSDKTQKPLPQIFSPSLPLSSPHHLQHHKSKKVKKGEIVLMTRMQMDGGHWELGRELGFNGYAVTPAIQTHKTYGQKRPAKHLFSFLT